jgi:hypothetical protein
MFRELNKLELDILTGFKKKGKTFRGLKPENARVQYTHQGNFTIATIELPLSTEKKSVKAGVAKFNPNDTDYDMSFGERRAFVAAIRN